MRSRRWTDLSPLALIVLFALFALFAGCATAGPIYSLSPTAGDVVWTGGRASMEKEIEGVRVVTGFESQYGDEALRLRVEVSNGTDERLELSPRQLTFSACSGTAVASCAATQRVIDPEAQLAGLEARAHQEAASGSASQGILGALVILSAIGDVASVASGHANSTTGLGTVAVAGAMEADAANTSRTLSNLEAEHELWANAALRRNTVLPGQTAAGMVFVPIVPSANYVWLHVRVGPRTFSFRFEQTCTMPQPPAPHGYSQNRD